MVVELFVAVRTVLPILSLVSGVGLVVEAVSLVDLGPALSLARLARH